MGGRQIASSNPKFYANSLEVSLRRTRLPMMTPEVCMMACRNPTRCGFLSYLMARASSEISWRVMRKTMQIRNIAMVI